MTITLNGTTGITLPNGSASAPAATGSDTDTGIVYGTNTVSLATGGTTAVTVDSSQNVGIGTSSPWSQISSYGASGATTQYLSFKNADGGDIRFGKASGVDNSCVLGTWAGNSMLFYTNSSERMRIDSSGNLLLNTTSNANNATLNVSGRDYWAMQVTCLNSSAGLLIGNTSGTSAYNALAFYSNGFSTPAGTITVTGGSTSYNTSSDYRLKESIAPMTGALDKVALLKPCTYTWKLDGSEGQGFIAHELAEVCPSAVTGEKDAVFEDGSIKPQGIDTSFLVATLTAAIQEAHGLIKDLQARVEVLETK